MQVDCLVVLGNKFLKMLKASIKKFISWATQAQREQLKLFALAADTAGVDISCFEELDVYKSKKSANDFSNYIRSGIFQFEFYERIIGRHAPHLLKQIRMLDYGCGGGQLAIPFASNYNPYSKIKSPSNSYLGLDVTQQRIEALQSIYNQRDNIHFNFFPEGELIDYIKARDSDTTQRDRSKSLVLLNKKPFDISSLITDSFLPNVQTSSSVFTHMTPDHIINRLKAFRDAGVELMINSWFCCSAVKLSLNNSSLTGKVRSFESFDLFEDYQCFVEDKENPLYTIGYSYDSIAKIYKESGSKILEIIPGDWASFSRMYQGNHDFKTYQDVIVSAPI